ncbi:MAG TPA: hypothetical protein VG268_14730 [Streptosporangiaceae bacterium]|nr:hypothetical protein [Streptosporangiaceae bacterium]
MVSTTDDAGFAPRSAAQAEHAPAGPQLGTGLGLSLDDAPEPVPSLVPALPVPSDDDGRLADRGHPGDPGFAVPGTPDGASVWQRAHAAWRAAGAEWSTSAGAPAPVPGSNAPGSNAPGSNAPGGHAPGGHAPGTTAPPHRRGRRRPLLLTAVVLVLVVALAWAGHTRFGPDRLGPRSYPAAQVASTQFSAGRTAAGRGLFQPLTRVSSSGNTVVAVGSQTGGDLTRGQFFVSTDAGNTWQTATVQAAHGGDPAPGHPAQLLAGGGDRWLAVGPHAIWTSQDARTWTLAATTGITPTDSGDQVQVLTRTATGWLAAGQNATEATGLIWTSRDGLHWQRATAAQALLPVHHATIVSITGAVAHGQDILLSGQLSSWYEEAGPRTTVTWLSTDGGRTWRSGSVPASNGASPGLAGLAVAGSGFIAVRPGTAPSGPGNSSRTAKPAGIVYASPNGLTWHYAATLTSAYGLRVSAVNGGAGGYAVLGQGPGGAMYGYTSADGAHWKPVTSFGPAPGTITGTTVTASGVQIATGATGTPTAERPYLAVAAPGHPPRAISIARIASGTITSAGVDAVAVSGARQVAVGEAGGTLAVWSRAATGSFTAGAWATADGEPPAVAGVQSLTSVVHGPAGWLATGNALAGTTPHPVLVSSPDGRSWRPDQAAELTRAHLATAQAAADDSRYVIVGSATTSAGTFPVAWTSRDLRTWTRAAGPASGGTGADDPGQLLGVAAGSSGFAAVGSDGIDPAAWTSADGRHWTAHTLKIPGTGASARLTRVAVNGRNVVAFGTEVWASGRRAALAEVSHDSGRTWVPVPFKSPGSVATVTAVIAISGGFTAVGTYGPGGNRDVAVWTSANGNTWLSQTPPGTGLSGPGIQQLNGLAATGSALTGVGFTATPADEHPTLWQVPSR